MSETSTMTYGRCLRVFVMGKTPRSLKWVELVNWTGQAFIGRRDHLVQVRERKELAEPGIYLLLSEGDNDGGVVEMYVGESDNFTDRLAQHISKDWWSQFVVFVSKDKNLTKAHVKYLERRIYELAKQSLGTVALKNSQVPGGASIPEPDVSSMEEFLQNIVFVLETLGLSYFPSEIEETEASPRLANKEVRTPISDGTEFYITLPKEFGTHKGDALKGLLQAKDGAFILKKGSFVRAVPRESFSEHGYWELWNQIIHSDAVVPSQFKDVCVLTRDIEFRSPSAAGAIVRAGQTNGRTDWKRIHDDAPLGACEIEPEPVPA